MLIVADVTIATSVDTIATTQVHNLAVADLTTATEADELALWSYGFVKPYAEPKTVILTTESQRTIVVDGHSELYTAIVSSAEHVH